MMIALEEAKESLRQGNHGFGAVIAKNGEVICSAHDEETTESDPTSHAEINAIRKASKLLGKDLSGCILVCTHEPCPMCGFAIVWSGIREVAYGYSIQNSISEGRKRIDFSVRDVFEKAEIDVILHSGILSAECAILYRQDVREEIKNLRNATESTLKELNADSIKRRTAWYKTQGKQLTQGLDPLDAAYQILLNRFHSDETEIPIIHKTDKQIVIHSMNFCPTLEACKILKIDTRFICKRLNENSTDALLKLIDTRLCFSRNYEKLRPYSPYCEEIITLKE